VAAAVPTPQSPAASGASYNRAAPAFTAPESNDRASRDSPFLLGRFLAGSRGWRSLNRSQNPFHCLTHFGQRPDEELVVRGAHLDELDLRRQGWPAGTGLGKQPPPLGRADDEDRAVIGPGPECLQGCLHAGKEGFTSLSLRTGQGGRLRENFAL